MKEIELKNTQNIRAALIFLNIFGLNLEERADLEKISQNLRIYNQQGKTIGELTINQNSIQMVASSSFGQLVANYDIPKINSLKDEEAPIKPALFTAWSNNINYSITNADIKITGELKIDCSMDTHIGLSCSCHPYLEYSNSSGTKIYLSAQREGNIFVLEITKPNKKETIKISPFDYLFSHSIKKRAKGNNKYDHINLITLADLPEEEKFRVTTIIQEDGEESNITTKKFVDDENYYQSIINKGRIMQQIDSEMYKTIQKVEALLNDGSVSIVINLISASLTNYSDEQISAMLGLERKKIIYQEGQTSLEDAYFGLVEGQKTYKLPTKKDINFQ